MRQAPPRHLIVRGQRVRLLHTIDRYPDFIIPEGSTGIILESSEEMVRVSLDVELEDLDEWDNELYFGDDEWEDARDCVREFCELI